MKSPTLVRPPITWHGSKATLARRILQHFPAHQTYVEPFGGSGALLLAKPRAPVEVYNDLSGNLVNLFRVLRDPSEFSRLRDAAGWTLYSRAEFNLSKEPHDDPVERARRFLVRCRQSRGGLGEQWSYCVSDSALGVSSAARKWLAGLERLPLVHQRLQGVQIEAADWRDVMRCYDSLETLFYLDPPYVPQTRVGGKYQHELELDDHLRIVEHLLRNVQGMTILSGYAHEAYAPLEAAGWTRHDYSVKANSSATRAARTESLWLSPNCQPRH